MTHTQASTALKLADSSNWNAAVSVKQHQQPQTASQSQAHKRQHPAIHQVHHLSSCLLCQRHCQASLYSSTPWIDTYRHGGPLLYLIVKATRLRTMKTLQYGDDVLFCSTQLRDMMTRYTGVLGITAAQALDFTMVDLSRLLLPPLQPEKNTICIGQQ